MGSLAAARARAFAFPEVTEAPHFESASWRVAGKIFVTIPPGGDRLHVLLDEEAVREAVQEDPVAFEELWWGKRLRGLRVVLAHASDEMLGELIEDAWRRRASRKLLRLLDAGTTKHSLD